MSDAPPPAPPGDDLPPEQILLSRRAAWILTVGFLLLLAVPPLMDGLTGRVRGLVSAVSGKGSRQPIAERLRDYDAGVASAAFTESPRQLTQQILTEFLNKGNDRVLTGRDGWLFYRPEIRALTGYGPLQPEPHSVSRDPSLLDWEAPLEPIKEFASQLKARGVALWLVPVPMKPGIYPEKLTGRPATGPVRHVAAAAFFRKLGEAGLPVHDLAPELWQAKTGDAALGPVYLKDDTHWTSRGMVVAAGSLARRIRQEPWWSVPPGPAWEITQESSVAGHGDLVEKLGLRDPDQWAPPRAEVLQVVTPPTGSAALADRESPVVVIGDSFVNIFDDPGLGFGRSHGGRSQAGLAWHLAAALGMPLDVHAVNGDGASGVRHWLAQRGESVVRSKKLVIWVIAERDLFLSRSVAKANQVAWERVTFAPDPPAGSPTPAGTAGPIVVEAEAVEKSEQPDPRRANYENALYTVQYRIVKTLSGPPVSGDIEVVHWHFKKRELQPAAAVEAGRSYRLSLEPWAAQEALQPINRAELGEAQPVWWSATAEPLP